MKPIELMEKIVKNEQPKRITIPNSTSGETLEWNEKDKCYYSTPAYFRLKGFDFDCLNEDLILEIDEENQ